MLQDGSSGWQKAQSQQGRWGFDGSHTLMPQHRPPRCCHCYCSNLMAPTAALLRPVVCRKLEEKVRALEQELAEKEDEVEEVREQAEAEADAARLAQMQVGGCSMCICNICMAIACIRYET